MGNLSKVDETSAAQKRHKTLPIPSSVSYIPGYPQKLFIYQLEASKYWWVRYFIAGKTLRKSTKCENKKQAIVFAKQFFYDVGNRHVHGEVQSQVGFASCAARNAPFTAPGYRKAQQYDIVTPTGQVLNPPTWSLLVCY